MSRKQLNHFYYKSLKVVRLLNTGNTKNISVFFKPVESNIQYLFYLKSPFVVD